MPFEIDRTELVWPGKYDENGERPRPAPADLPFQVIERVNDSRATRETEKSSGLSLFDEWGGGDAQTFEEGWRSKLIWGDNLLVLKVLLEHFTGAMDLIYIDPPFATGADFKVEAPVGDTDVLLDKEHSALEEKAYRDTWGRGIESYVEMMYVRLAAMRDLLSDEGSLYVHCDWRVNSHLRLVLDELFGPERFQREIIWDISVLSGFKTLARNWIRGHDTILFYTKSADPIFNKQTTEHRPEYLERFNKTDRDGRKYFDGRGGRRYLDEVVEKGKAIGDVWDDIMSFQQVPTSKERVGYETQKPANLLERILAASSQPDSLVGDFFCGSGTTMVAAERMGRRWIGCDLGRFAVHTSRKRLLDLAGCKPFEVLNLGKYERQYWRVATFGEDLDDDGAISLYEYIAFILKLYGATPVTGHEYVHGKFGSAVVQVGPVDSPVTMSDVQAGVEECRKLKHKELHVLGWEWEMGLPAIVDRVKSQGVKLVLRQIPREVMEKQVGKKGDVKFFELAYLDAAISKARAKRSFRVKLENFVMPNPELAPADVRKKIKKWSDYVDYWAVDWNFSDDSFVQGWVTYRTRQDRSLELSSDSHQYEKAGKYSVMVKVIDIFGNDTSTILPHEVK